MEIDGWVTDRVDNQCGSPIPHMYRCLRDEAFNEDVYGIGAHVEVDGSTYVVCYVMDMVGCGAEGEHWWLVYVHGMPQGDTEKDWYELYGNNGMAGYS